MLDAAQRRAEQLGIDERPLQADRRGGSIDHRAASLDGVLCRWGYMLMADPEAALRETRRVLSPARGSRSPPGRAEDNPWSAIPRASWCARGLLEPPPPASPGQFAWAAPSG